MFKKLFSLLILILVSFESIFAGFLSEKFSNISTGFYQFFSNASAVSVLMYFAFFFGVFSLMKNLLGFAFKSHPLGQENKAKTVLAFMISFIGTSGIFYMFKSSPRDFVLFFGGIFGLLILIVFSILIMQLFLSFANSLSPKHGDKRENVAAYWTIMVLGALLVSYMIFGFAGKILVEMGCSSDLRSLIGEFKGVPYSDSPENYVCNQSTLFSKVFSWSGNLVEVLVTIAFFLGIWWLITSIKSKNGDDGDDDSSSKKQKESEKHAKEVKELVKGFHNSMDNAHTHFNEKTSALQELQDELRRYG
jgi:hypothetical protein